MRGLDQSAFLSDLETIYAVTRCLEIISEASRRLESQIKTRHKSIAWGAMAAAGNIYRHDDEDVSATRVWGVLKTDLAPLRIAIITELASEQ